MQNRSDSLSPGGVTPLDPKSFNEAVPEGVSIDKNMADSSGKCSSQQVHQGTASAGWPVQAQPTPGYLLGEASVSMDVGEGSHEGSLSFRRGKSAAVATPCAGSQL